MISLATELGELSDLIIRLPNDCEEKTLLLVKLHNVVQLIDTYFEAISEVPDPLDMAYVMFDLEATRRERDKFREELDAI